MTTRTLYEWFARSAEQTPDAPSLDIDGQTWTFDELRRGAEVVAASILAVHGTAPDRVALLASRSLVAFTGYLATLRLGATIVPLNPMHPVHRNEIICGSLKCDVLIGDDNGVAQLAVLGEAAGTVLPLTDSDIIGASVTTTLPELRTEPDDVAYVLFTSGSTGRPKGVPITHRNVSPYVAHNIAQFDVGPGCRVSHTFDFTFDPSIFDLFVTWGGGAMLVSPSRMDLLAPVDFLANKAITHWFSVPSVVSVCANLGNLPTGRRTVLRQSIFIGEQLTYGQAAAWHAVAPQARMDNVYGPTELTVACTQYRIPDDLGQWPSTSNDTVPIGPVYDYLEHVIVDENGIQADEGELCVRGVQRFSGYLDPSDNRGRFLIQHGDRYMAYDGVIPEPACYYRTGDRVRWEQGELVHLSRLDHQIKIRGYRVELGEIESAIARHPEVNQAVVISDATGDSPELVGFYTGSTVPERQLIRWLREYLPLYMVPRRLHRCTELPLNVNGKIDRNALQAVVQTGTSWREPTDVASG